MAHPVVARSVVRGAAARPLPLGLRGSAVGAGATRRRSQRQRHRHGAAPSFLGGTGGEALATPASAGPSRRSARGSKAVTKMGLPIVGWIINPITVFFAYAFGAARFASGFARTSYNNTMGTKVALAALWPALYAVSPAFRKNFKRACS